MKSTKTDRKYHCSFLAKVSPIKITECRRLKINLKSWSILTDYVLESVKINRYKPNEVSSTAVLRVADESGHVTCILKGKDVGLLFGLTSQEWTNIEDLCGYGHQLFFRYFKNGLNKNFTCEQKLFYNFCLSNRKENVFIAIFYRSYNNRNKDKNNALINITELRKETGYALDLYINYLRNVHILRS